MCLACIAQILRDVQDAEGEVARETPKEKEKDARETREKGTGKTLIGEPRSFATPEELQATPLQPQNANIVLLIPLKFSVSFCRVLSRVSRAMSPSATPATPDFVTCSSVEELSSPQ
jgi:hypothetical protein